MPRILLVEDDADTEQLILRVLRRCGVAEVLVVRDGGEALRVMQSSLAQFGLVLLDKKLPTHDGSEVLRRLATGRRECPPIVVFSSEDSPASALEAKRLGASEYAVKPIEYEELMQTIENLVRKYVPVAAS